MQLPLVLGHVGVALELIHRQLVRRRAGLLLLRLLLALLPCPPLLPLSSTGGCCALSSASLLNPATTPRCMRLKLLELNEGRRVGHHIGPASITRVASWALNTLQFIQRLSALSQTLQLKTIVRTH